MERHRRMDRTLFSLLVSMTLGALLLHFGQPIYPEPAIVPTELTAHSGWANTAWHTIRIDPRQELDPHDDATHIFVDRDGRLVQTASWEAQRDIQQAGVVRIGMVVPRYSNRVTGLQRSATEAVIRQLRAECGIAPDQVLWDDTLQVPPPSPLPLSARPRVHTSPGSP
jgi:hypothetical protein